MANNRKYYWLKLKDDFFKSRVIKKLRKIAGGDTYTIIYLKIQLLSIKKSGMIEFEKTESNIIEQLALELDEDIENVKITLSYLQANNLIEQISDDEYLLNKIPELIGNETTAAERMRKMREKRNKVTPLLQDVEQSYTEIEIEIEKDIEKDINIGKDKKIKDKDKDIDFMFEELWKAYPKKKGKGAVTKTQKNKLFKIGPDEMLRTIERYKTDIIGTEEKYIKNGSTFFNSGYVDYLDANYETSNVEEIENEKPQSTIYQGRGYDW